jgi:hypothetical protein
MHVPRVDPRVTILLAFVACHGGAPQPVPPPATPATTTSPPPAAQNPSPMVERTRAHERVASRQVPGIRDTIDGVLARPVPIFLSPAVARATQVPLLVHFLGPAYIAEQAAADARDDFVVATVQLGAGSGAYDRPFRGTDRWVRLRAAIDSVVAVHAGRRLTIGPVYLSAFSAGNGAVRAILADSVQAAGIAGILDLDGIHTSYVPEGRVVEQGGTLDPANLEALLRYARRAVRGEARMMVTHSEVFPGTFASTTETANWLLDALGVARKPVLAWGPVGMQQTSEARSGAFRVLGYAGNSAPDHLDHLHALPALLRLLLEE